MREQAGVGERRRRAQPVAQRPLARPVEPAGRPAAAHRPPPRTHWSSSTSTSAGWARGCAISSSLCPSGWPHRRRRSAGHCSAARAGSAPATRRSPARSSSPNTSGRLVSSASVGRSAGGSRPGHLVRLHGDAQAASAGNRQQAAGRGQPSAASLRLGCAGSSRRFIARRGGARRRADFGQRLVRLLVA